MGIFSFLWRETRAEMEARQKRELDVFRANRRASLQSFIADASNHAMRIHHDARPNYDVVSEAVIWRHNQSTHWIKRPDCHYTTHTIRLSHRYDDWVSHDILAHET